VQWSYGMTIQHAPLINAQFILFTLKCMGCVTLNNNDYEVASPEFTQYTQNSADRMAGLQI